MFLLIDATIITSLAVIFITLPFINMQQFKMKHGQDTSQKMKAKRSTIFMQAKWPKIIYGLWNLVPLIGSNLFK